MEVLSNEDHANLVGDFRDAEAKLQWESIDNNLYRLDESTLLVSWHCKLPRVALANIGSLYPRLRRMMHRCHMTYLTCEITLWLLPAMCSAGLWTLHRLKFSNGFVLYLIRRPEAQLTWNADAHIWKSVCENVP